MTDKLPALTDPPEGYREWLVELKSRIHSAQQRAFSKEWPNFEIWRQAAARLSWGSRYFPYGSQAAE